MYKDHIIMMMKDFFKLEDNVGLIDIEFYLKQALKNDDKS